MTKYWFRRRKGLFTKDLGWGWTPISLEGWAVVTITLILIFLSYSFWDIKSAEYGRGIGFLVTLIILIVVSGAISEWKTQKD